MEPTDGTSGAPSASNAYGNTSEPPQTYIDKTEAILAMIKGYNHYTLGDFLYIIFNFTQKLNQGSQRTVAKWLAGGSRAGTRPPEIIQAMYQHNYSLKHQDRKPLTANYKNLSLPQRPPASRSIRSVNFLPLLPPAPIPGQSLSDEELSKQKLCNSREGLEEFAAHLILFYVDREM